jgi:RimJ/RimL family protein N-acetyltransferase
MPSIPELAEPLSDGYVRLRMAAERDIPEVLIAYQDDPELHVRLGEERPPSGAQLGRRIEHASAALEAGTQADLTITDPAGDDCRGQIYVHHVDWEQSRAELGIWLAPRARGRGAAPRALTLAADWLFEACGMERLQVLTETDNEAMLRTARAVGFTHEGILRSYARERGARVDLAVLSLLPRDL